LVSIPTMLKLCCELGSSCTERNEFSTHTTLAECDIIPQPTKRGRINGSIAAVH
jgi:hypothetical protein